MYILITYDVVTEDKAGQRRLRRVARACENIGQRVQNSVFECSLDEAQYVVFRNELKELIDTDKDSLRFYNLGNKYTNKVIHEGTKETYMPNDTFIL